MSGGGGGMGAASGERARSADGEYSTPATRAAAVETYNRVYESVTLSQLPCLAPLNYRFQKAGDNGARRPHQVA